jgi:hypothetical protein
MAAHSQPPLFADETTAEQRLNASFSFGADSTSETTPTSKYIEYNFGQLQLDIVFKALVVHFCTIVILRTHVLLRVIIITRDTVLL